MKMETINQSLELNGSLKIYQAVFEESAKGIGIFDLEGNLLKTNKTCRMFLGYDNDESVCLTLKNITHPDDWPVVEKAFEEFQQGKRDRWRYDHRLLKKNGDPIWVRIVRSLIRDAVGNPKYMLCMGDDISDLKNKEAELLDYQNKLETTLHKLTVSEENYKRLINSIDSIIYVCNKNQEVVFTNKKYTETFGEIEKGKKCFDQIFNFKESCQWCDLSKVIETDLPVTSDIYNPRDDRWYSCTLSPCLANGRAERYMAVLTDITNRKRSEQELIETKTKFQAISDNALDGIIMLNSKGNITYYNKAFAHILGYKSEELNQEILSIIVNKAISDYPDLHLQPLLEQENKTFELQTITKAKIPVHLSLSISSIILNSEKHLVILVKDITENKNVQKTIEQERNKLEILVKERTQELNNSLEHLQHSNYQLHKANNHKNIFLSSMSHELRTPLNSILGFADLLDHQYFGNLNQQQLEYIHLIRNSGQHLLELINDLLDITKIDAGNIELTAEKFYPIDVITEVITTLRTQYGEKSVDCQVFVTEHTSMVGDKKRFRQIITNLLSNAFKFTPENGKIVIGENQTANTDTIVFTVKDTGVGIKKGDYDKIFAQFYQTDLLRDQNLGGSGMGLAITKKIIEAQGGSISVESELGKGTSFTFSIPKNSSATDNCNHCII